MNISEPENHTHEIIAPRKIHRLRYCANTCNIVNVGHFGKAVRAEERQILSPMPLGTQPAAVANQLGTPFWGYPPMLERRTKGKGKMTLVRKISTKGREASSKVSEETRGGHWKEPVRPCSTGRPWVVREELAGSGSIYVRMTADIEVGKPFNW